MHAGTDTYIACDSCQQIIAAASLLRDMSESIILRMQPDEHRSDEPFATAVLGFIWAIGEPEAGLETVAQPGCLRSVRANQRMKILVRNQTSAIEQARVRPVHGRKQISGARSWLKAHRQHSAICVQAGAPGRKLRA